MMGFFLCTNTALAQSIKNRPEIITEKDTKAVDSLNKIAADSVKLTHKGALSQIIEYSSTDSLIYDFGETDTIALLYKRGKVVSADEGMEITADFLKVDRRTMIISATGAPDSAGVIVGKPSFKEGGRMLKMDTLVHNYRTSISWISNVITQEGDGFLHGGITKRMPDKSTFLKDGKYTTCDHEHPHYYLHMTRGKLVEGNPKKVYFGFSYMVIEDVPIPLFLPFGFFPQMSDRSSGIKFPTYGEEVSRGFFLENLGIYLALGEYMDLEFTGSIYSLGSWSTRAASSYTKRYKYNGGFNLEYNVNVTGERGSTDFAQRKDFAIRWNHRQNPKARPGTNFSASVNFSSISADKYNNSHDPFQSITNTTNSSVSYSKTWDGTPFNFSTNFNHSQNMNDSTYAITFPNFTFTVNRIYPLRAKERIGKKKLYEDVSFTYSTAFNNRMNFKSNEIGSTDFWKKMDNNMQHRFGLSLPSFSLLKYINLSPSVSYDMSWFFKSRKKHWDAEKGESYEDIGEAFSAFGITQSYSFGASMDTRMYGTLNFKKGRAIQAIRHVVKPSIGFNYVPNLRTHANGWRKIQSGASINNIEEYNIYGGGAPGSSESGSISFALGNTLELKVRNKKDTTGKSEATRKISIFDNLNVGTSYNLLADSMNLSNISINGSTNVLGKLGLSFGASIDPYSVNEAGQRINRFYWAEKGGLNIGQLRNFRFSFGYSFSGGRAIPGSSSTNTMNSVPGSGGMNIIDENNNMMQQENISSPAVSDPFFYQEFNMPWTFSFDYGYNYSKTTRGYKSHVQTLNFSGSVSPSEKWRISFRSGFDIKLFKLTTTNINISRDLHCFNFSFNWVPLGQMKSYSFRIAITSSMLSDILKYDKRSSPWDRD